MRFRLSIQTAATFPLAGLAAALLLASPASAIIVDAGGDARPLLTPPASVIGAWGNNAAAVAIGPNHL
ncbi:MAG: hypothetical protein AAF328_08920, partial [Planctomycetota bacterium]